jgi:hypothetical protein
MGAMWRSTFLALLAWAAVLPAADLEIGSPAHYTENRGRNEAGLGPFYQVVVTATVVPSDFPTLVFAEQANVREAMLLFATTLTPDTYVHWRRLDPSLTGSWRIVAARGEARANPVSTPALAKPQEVPLVRNLRVNGGGVQPRLTWELPDLTGFDVERIRVGVRGGKRLHGPFMDLLYVSGDLPADATAFTIPAGVLAAGERYVFQVMLEDLEGGALENRSLTFSDPYTVPR